MRNGHRLDDVWSRWDKRVRDSIIFAIGIIGCINELFIVEDPRPYALVFLASLIGIPFVLSADENKGNKETSEPAPPPDQEDGNSDE